MGKFFTLRELTQSATAYKLKIDNTPSAEIVEHLEELIEFMDGFRAYWGGPLIVSSGYRCPELNEAVGGAKNSGHKYGWAIDFVPANNKKVECYEKFQEYLKGRDFDELILERGSGGRIWLHFSLYSWQGKQRRKIKELETK